MHNTNSTSTQLPGYYLQSQESQQHQPNSSIHQWDSQLHAQTNCQQNKQQYNNKELLSSTMHYDLNDYYTLTQQTKYGSNDLYCSLTTATPSVSVVSAGPMNININNSDEHYPSSSAANSNVCIFFCLFVNS